MTTELRATGMTEEQRDELAKQLETRGVGGWEAAGEPRQIIGEGEDAEYGPQTFGISIPIEGADDVASIVGWLDSQRIAHSIEQPETVEPPQEESTASADDSLGAQLQEQMDAREQAELADRAAEDEETKA